MAILKHIASKSSNYGAALEYLIFKHDELRKTPILDQNGNRIMRDEFYLDGLNCEPYSFDAACQQLNREYQKNKNKDEIKSHHYIISFDPRDNTENCLTGKRAQELGLEYAKANFPGSRLVRRSASYKDKRYIYYQCSGSKQNKGSCTSHNLRDEKLYNIVRNALQMQIQIVMEEAEFVESIRQARQEPYRVRRIERQIRQLTAEKAHTQGIKEKLYGDYAEEILTREDFLNYNELYSKRIEEYDRKITELEAERQNLQTAPNTYPFLDVYRKYVPCSSAKVLLFIFGIIRF